jgi:hypothetical protein
MATTSVKTRTSAEIAAQELRSALANAGIVLPSLSVDVASPDLQLVELGRVNAEVAAKLAEAVRKGCKP